MACPTVPLLTIRARIARHRGRRWRCRALTPLAFACPASCTVALRRSADRVELGRAMIQSGTRLVAGGLDGDPHGRVCAIARGWRFSALGSRSPDMQSGSSDTVSGADSLASGFPLRPIRNDLVIMALQESAAALDVQYEHGWHLCTRLLCPLTS